jgi:hypothetical protein
LQLELRYFRLGVAQPEAYSFNPTQRERDGTLGVKLLCRQREQEERDAQGVDWGSGADLSDGCPPDAKYQFKHALVQEAAYASLVRNSRPLSRSAR